MKSKELFELIDKVHIIDVRENDEYASGWIQNAIKIPLSVFKNALALSDQEFQQVFKTRKFIKADKIVVYCLSGARSGHLCKYLQSLGYNASNLEGGLLMWSYSLQSI